MKKFQLLGLCLIGSLLAVHPISGSDYTDFPVFSGEDLQSLYSLVFGTTEDGEGGNPQSPISPMMDEEENVSHEELKGRIRSLCFGRTFENPTLNPNFAGARFVLNFNDCDSNKRGLKQFFEKFAPNNKDLLQCCGHQLFREAEFDLETWNSKDCDYKTDKMYEFIIAHMMMEKIIDGFSGQKLFIIPEDTKLYCNTCNVDSYANEEHYKELFGNLCEGEGLLTKSAAKKK